MSLINSPTVRRRLALLVVVIVIIIFGLILRTALLNRHFRVVSTNPATNKVATATPFFKVIFDRPLNSLNVSVASKPIIISNYAITGDVLTINLNPSLSTKQKYTITINTISDTKGDKLNNLKFSFTPSLSASENLPADQQQQLIQEQTTHPSQPTFVSYLGIDQLLNYGVTNAQISDIETAFLRYDPSAQTVSIDDSTIAPVPHDSNSSNTYDTINFTVSIDSLTYIGSVQYSNLTDAALTLLNVQTNAQVYSSGTIGS